MSSFSVVVVSRLQVSGLFRYYLQVSSSLQVACDPDCLPEYLSLVSNSFPALWLVQIDNCEPSYNQRGCVHRTYTRGRGSKDVKKLCMLRTSTAAGKNRGVACFSLLSMEERRRRGCLLTPLTKLHLPVHTFQPIKLK